MNEIAERVRATSGQRRARRRRRRRSRLLFAHLRLVNPVRADVSAIDREMMKRAIQVAAQAAAIGEVPVGAVVYRGEEIIAECANNREATKDPAGHAELLAMRLAGQRLGTWRLSDCSLAVTLEPCPMCAGAMVNARLGRLVYGATDPKAGAVHTLYEIPTDRRLNHRVHVVGGVEAGRCRDLLRDFFRKRRGVVREPKISGTEPDRSCP